MTDRQPGKSGSVLFAVTIFTSAFLLFQVQPLLAKFILPWFGGTPAVWTMCMLVFQMLLFGGYAYAHLLSCIRSVPRQAIIHAFLLTAAALMLPIVPDTGWKPVGDEAPGLRITLLLLATVGMPYFLLSSTGPLLQKWFSTACPGTIAISTVCSVQHRIAAGTGLLSVCFRTGLFFNRSGMAVVSTVSCVRSFVSDVRLEDGDFSHPR